MRISTPNRTIVPVRLLGLDAFVLRYAEVHDRSGEGRLTGIAIDRLKAIQ